MEGILWNVFYFFPTLHSCRVLRLESCRRKETGHTLESVILPWIVGSPIHVWKLAYFHTSVLPGQYKYQPYQKPLWNTANPKMTVKNQTKQAPERNWPFDIYFRTPKVNRNFLLNRVQTLSHLICANLFRTKFVETSYVSHVLSCTTSRDIYV